MIVESNSQSMAHETSVLTIFSTSSIHIYIYIYIYIYIARKLKL